jgi:hypothetical protein
MIQQSKHPKGLKELKAAVSRFDDWEVLSKGENRRKACSIHLGGIYIECLLKGMLCSQCSVTAGTNQSQWIINGCEKAGRDGKNLGKHRTNNSK